MRELLDNLIRDARVWRAGQPGATETPADTTGHAILDGLLQDTGWPKAALTECLLDHPGIGELQLMLPLMQRQSDAGKTLFWINPPHIPYAPALERHGICLSRLVIARTRSPADTLWTLENCLRSSVAGLVMAWPERLKPGEIRRLQLAAEAGDSPCILFRNSRAANQSSPAALRLQLSPSCGLKLNVQVLKRRGGWAANHCQLQLPERLPGLTHDSARIVQGPWPEPGQRA